MRVECASCRELFAPTLAITAGALRVACPACHHVMTAAVGAPPREDPAPPASEAGAQCPKCGAPRRDAAACPVCGLAAARMAAYADAREAAVPDAVRDAWQRVTEAWDDTARHDELFRLVAAHESYAWAAGRYRTRSDDQARRQLDRLRRAAEATLLASATARPEKTASPYRATRGVLMILIVAAAVGLIYAMVMRDRPPAAPRRPEIPARPLQPGRPVSPSSIR